MRASAPFSKAVLELAHGSSSSRIPHLIQHILARQSRSPVRTPRTTVSIKQRRCLHASTAQPKSPTITFDAESQGEEHDEPPSPYQSFEDGLSASSVPHILKTEIEEVLQERHPDRVLFAILNPSSGHDFIRRADSTSFADAFTAIDPQYFIEPMKDVYRFMKPSLSSEPEYRWVRRFDERLISFKISLETIIRVRREAGHKLSLEVCRHYLDWARILGDAGLAKHIMWHMIPADAVEPDLHCYNYFMEACCWNHAWSKSEQWRLRVTPQILAIRGVYRRPADLKGHRIGGAPGLRYKMLSTFKELVAKGHKGNEETFTTLMVAMGRENDLTGAKSILRSVYNIDVDLLEQLDEEEIETPTFYEDDSPLRPSARLLFTVAHVFGSNNEIGTAMKLVDYISRQYNLQILPDVWMHLFEWSLILQFRRTTSERKQGQGLGYVPQGTLEQLWVTMTDAPHNMKPNVVMHTLRARARRDALHLEDTLECLRTAREELDSSRRRLQLCSVELVSWIEDHTDQLHEGFLLPTEWYKLRRNFLMESLKVDRDLQLLAIAVRQVLSEFHWPEYTPPNISQEPNEARRQELWKEWDNQYQSKALDWERRQLPVLLEYFAEYLPNNLVYKTTGGYFSINGKDYRNDLVSELWGDQLTRTGIMRASLDTEDHDKMLEGMRRLPQMLKDAEKFTAGIAKKRAMAMMALKVRQGRGNVDALMTWKPDKDKMIREKNLMERT